MSLKLSDAKRIFLEAVEKYEPEQWPRFLDQVCEGGPILREKVEALLQVHGQRNSLLDDAAAATCLAGAPTCPRPGSLIGPYKLREQIGEGGFGVVYVAEQTEPVERKVALKIIKPGMDTREVIARFEAERQTLARMDHPNVARVLDAGTTDSGRPYFVMELVHGISLTEFCDEQQLTNRERLSLFIDVCRAVQHAHQKGIIHRDLKPSNIMVTMHDDRPVPKVIDFGVSKALSQKLTEKTIYTAYGQMVGTPMYMSPEQAQMSGLDIDTRSDVYSLGVLLYQLLTGRTPFDRQTLEKAGFDELRRIIREDDPPRPSAMVSTLKADALSTAAARRRIDHRRLSSSLRGELDWIVMQALEKDRTRRYQSASSFAEDVQHYLCDEPVVACPPSAGYRFRKFARRNSAVLVTVALVVISLVAGTGISIWQAVRATGAEQLAEGRLEAIGEQQRQTESQRQRAEANLQLALETLEQIYLPLAEVELSEQIKLTERDRQFLEKALPFYEQLAAQRADDPEMRYVEAHAHLRVGNIYRNLRTHPDEKVEPAEAALRQAIALFQQLAEEAPGNLTYRRKLAQSYRGLGTLLLPLRRPEAKQAFRTVINLYEPVILESGSASDFASRGYCYRQLRRDHESLADYLRAVELEPMNASFHQCLSQLYTNVRVLDLGLAVMRAQHAVELEPANPWYWSQLAYVYMRQRNLQDAREACVRALSLDANLSNTNLQMAEILRLEGDFEQALVFAQKGFQGHEPEPKAYQTRGMLYSKLGRFQEALADFNKAVELVPDNTWVYRGRAQIFVKLGRFEEALVDYAKAVEQAPENLIQLNNTAFDMVRDPGWDPEMLAHPIAWLRRAIELDPECAPFWKNLGLAYYRAGNWQEAIAALEKSLTLNPDRFNYFFLAMAHWQLGNQDEAQQWYGKSAEWMEKHGLNDEPDLLRFRAEAEKLMGIEQRTKRKSGVNRHGSDASDSAANSEAAASNRSNN